MPATLSDALAKLTGGEGVFRTYRRRRAVRQRSVGNSDTVPLLGAPQSSEKQLFPKAATLTRQLILTGYSSRTERVQQYF